MSLNILVLCYTYQKELSKLPYLRIYDKCLGDIKPFPWEKIKSITLIGDAISNIDPVHTKIKNEFNIKVNIFRGNIITFDFPEDIKYDLIINEHCPVFNIFASSKSFFDVKTKTYDVSLDSNYRSMYLLRDKMKQLILNKLEPEGEFISNGSEQLINYFLNVLRHNNNYELTLEREETLSDFGKKVIEIGDVPRKMEVHPFYKHKKALNEHIKGYNYEDVTLRSIYFVIRKKINLIW